MYCSLVRPHLDYCSQLWGPGEGPSLDRLEQVQSYFTRLVPGICHLDYGERLKALNITSVKRRFDRYRIFYTRKILTVQVPNVGLEVESHVNSRLGLKIRVPTTMNSSTLYCDSFAVKGPRIFNVLPKDLRNITDSDSTFKKKLDDFLTMIPDEPRITYGTRIASNELDHKISEWRWKVMYHC